MKSQWALLVQILVWLGGVVNTTGLHPVDPELAEISAAETAESAVFIFPSMKMNLLSLVGFKTKTKLTNSLLMVFNFFIAFFGLLAHSFFILNFSYLFN